MLQLIEEVQLYTDGGCRGNSGPGAIGVIIMDAEHHELFAGAECIGLVTNNRAEYRAWQKVKDLELVFQEEVYQCPPHESVHHKSGSAFERGAQPAVVPRERPGF